MSNDIVVSALHDALRGLSMRQRAIADNIANVQTPGYRARRVAFESSLASALRTGDDRPVEVTDSRSSDPTRLDGNNVNLDDETVSMVETGLRYQTMVEALNAKFGLLRTAIRG